MKISMFKNHLFDEEEKHHHLWHKNHKPLPFLALKSVWQKLNARQVLWELPSFQSNSIKLHSASCSRQAIMRKLGLPSPNPIPTCKAGALPYGE
jgi:hypothetical protein